MELIILWLFIGVIGLFWTFIGVGFSWLLLHKPVLAINRWDVCYLLVPYTLWFTLIVQGARSKSLANMVVEPLLLLLLIVVAKTINLAVKQHRVLVSKMAFGIILPLAVMLAFLVPALPE